MPYTEPRLFVYCIVIRSNDSVNHYILVVLIATELYGTLVRNTCVTCCRRRRCACVVFVCLFVCLFLLLLLLL